MILIMDAAEFDTRGQLLLLCHRLIRRDNANVCALADNGLGKNYRVNNIIIDYRFVEANTRHVDPRRYNNIKLCTVFLERGKKLYLYLDVYFTLGI